MVIVLPFAAAAAMLPLWHPLDPAGPQCIFSICSLSLRTDHPGYSPATSGKIAKGGTRLLQHSETSQSSVLLQQRKLVAPTFHPSTQETEAGTPLGV